MVSSKKKDDKKSPKRSPWLKRVKRHVSGPMQSFFAAAPPGLEKLCLDELCALPLSKNDTKIVKGGVEFKGRMHDCYLANLNLRTANRILMRIADFPASNFVKLEKRASAIPWELFIHQGIVPEVKVTSRHSRLFHKGAVSDRIEKSISNRLDQFGFAFRQKDQKDFHTFPQQIFVRAVDDIFTLSMDSSGELLHKRGIKKHSAHAPIRETLAAAILKLAGYNPKEPLLDPMCGSGTFSLEGAMRTINMPAGWFRDFAFMGWPCFRPLQWAHMKREAEKLFTPVTSPLIFASDKDQKVCKAFKKKINEYNLTETIDVSCGNFLDLSTPFTTDQTGLVVINPPYGLRMGNRPESLNLFHAIINKLKKEYPGWKIAIIVPDDNLLKKIPFKQTRHRLSHGGLKLTLVCGKIL
jgi:putative N6-adenine-specific DNA methylase